MKKRFFVLLFLASTAQAQLEDSFPSKKFQCDVYPVGVTVGKFIRPSLGLNATYSFGQNIKLRSNSSSLWQRETNVYTSDQKVSSKAPRYAQTQLQLAFLLTPRKVSNKTKRNKWVFM